MPRPRSHTPGFCLDSFHQLAYVPLNGRRKHLGAYPVEKYRRRVEKLKTDFATGKITAEQLVHSTRRAKWDCATGENRDAYRRAVKDFREAEPKVDPRNAGQRINVNALVNAWL